MISDRNTEDHEARFEHKYSERISRAACRLEEMALGHAVGLHGYTTLAQAQQLADALALRPQDLLLDMGAGRGWPGIHIAQSSGCHLVALDIPFDAMHAALTKMQPIGPGRTCAAVVADGRAAPLHQASVDAVVHADSF